MPKENMLSEIKNNFFRQAEKRIERETIDVEKIHNLSITTGEADVEFFLHHEPRVEIVLETYENGPELLLHYEGNSLKIEAKSDQDIIQSIFLRRTPTCSLQITLPNNISDEYLIKTGSGDVDLDGLELVKLEVTTGSGDIRISNIVTAMTEISSGSGDLYIQSVLSEEMIVQTSSGDAYLKRISGNLFASSSSGDIDVIDCQCERIKLKSSSGDIKLMDCQSKELLSQSSSGDMKGEEIQTVDCQLMSTSGDVTFKNFIGNVLAKSSSGDLNFYFESGSNFVMQSGSGDINVYLQYPQVDAKVEVKTGSGEFETNLTMKMDKFSSKYITGKIGEAVNSFIFPTGSSDIKLINKSN